MKKEILYRYALKGIDSHISIVAIPLGHLKQSLKNSYHYDGHFTTAYEADEIQKIAPCKIRELEEELLTLKAYREEILSYFKK